MINHIKCHPEWAVIFVSALLLAATILYPPWKISVQSQHKTLSQPFGWAFLLNPPDSPDAMRNTSAPDPATFNQKLAADIFGSGGLREATPWPDRSVSVQIDLLILLFEWLIVLIPAAALVAFFRSFGCRNRRQAVIDH